MDTITPIPAVEPLKYEKTPSRETTPHPTKKETPRHDHPRHPHTGCILDRWI